MSPTIKKEYSVLGMTCASCASSLQSWLTDKPGIVLVNVNYPSKSLEVEFNPALVTFKSIKKSAKEIGYDLKETQDDGALEARLKVLRNKLVVSAIIAVPVVILSMWFHQALPYQHWVIMILTVPVLYYAGSEFIINAWKRAQHGQTNMDTLVALSTQVAFLYSAAITIFPSIFVDQSLQGHIYFESAVVIIFFILLGRYLEEKAKISAIADLTSLMMLQQKDVTIIESGTIIKKKIEDVVVGNVVMVKPGEKVPLDGRIIQGASYLDERLLTGEPIAVKKQEGDQVFAGTINQSGGLSVQVLKKSDETVLAKIIAHVKAAQNSKPPVQKLVDKVAAIFVPVVMVIALVAFLYWMFFGPQNSSAFAVQVLIAVLIIACPCALGLATPTALIVGMGKAATKGILIKDAAQLELAHAINTLVLDKTGTITEGKPTVVEAFWAQDVTEIDLEVFNAMEKYSSHPLASAIVEQLNVPKVMHLEIQNVEGNGLIATFHTKVYCIGSPIFILSKANCDVDLLNQYRDYETKAGSIVMFAKDDKIIGIMRITDQIKEGSQEAIAKLSALGIEVHMISGDREENVKSVADELGIKNYRSQVIPTDKGNYVDLLKQKGFKVAMAGDGINDAVALAKADIGIAMGAGADVALETAGITLLKGDLNQIITSVALSKATLSTIRQNLFFAFAYNIVAIPIAAGVLYSINGYLLNPMLAGAAMALSSISVLMNSLWLKIRRI